MSGIFSKDFENKKKALKILILGPYVPPSAKERLSKFRDCLKSHGYENAWIVEDFKNFPLYDKDPDKHFTLKSQDKIKNWADVLIFVFMRETSPLGAWTELQFTINFVASKIHNSIELHEEGFTSSTQTRGRLKISRMDSYEFQDDFQLCTKAKAFCTNVVYMNLWKS